MAQRYHAKDKTAGYFLFANYFVIEWFHWTLLAGEPTE